MHCSASPQGRGDTSIQIDQWHRERGFKCIGYHYVILEDGTVEIGRPEWAVGAHCRAKGMNHVSIGVCFIGEGGDMTTEQLLSFMSLSTLFEYKYQGIQIKGHCDFEEGKTCPGYGKNLEGLTGFIKIVNVLKLEEQNTSV